MFVFHVVSCLGLDLSGQWGRIKEDHDCKLLTCKDRDRSKECAAGGGGGSLVVYGRHVDRSHKSRLVTVKSHCGNLSSLISLSRRRI